MPIKQFRIINKGKGPLIITKDNLQEVTPFPDGLATHPLNPIEGVRYFNTVAKTEYIYAPGNASSDVDGWLDLGSTIPQSGNTSVSQGTRTANTVNVDSSTGLSATLTEATTLLAGVLSAATFNEIAANTLELLTYRANWNNAYSWGDHALAGYLTSLPFVDNSIDWNNAYSWGDHALAGYLTSLPFVDNSIDWNNAYSWGDHALAGYLTSLPFIDNSANWNTVYSWGNHASAGYLTSIISHSHVISDVAFLQLSLDSKVDDGQVLTNVPAGAVFTDTIYTLPFIDNSSNWNIAYSKRINTLTNIGTDGPATLLANVLNIPVYSLTGLGGQPLDADLTAIASLNGNVGILTKTAANTWALDTNNYALNSSLHNILTIGTNANGLSLGTHPSQVLSLGLASATTSGAISSTDWNNFNNKLSDGAFIQDQINEAQHADIWIDGTIIAFNMLISRTPEADADVTNKLYVDDLLFLKEDKLNKQDSLVIDGTGILYPTVDAVNAGLLLKENVGVAASLDAQHLLDFAHGDIAHTNRVALNAITNAGSGLIITAIERTNYNTAFGWGSHAGLYLPIGTQLPITKVAVSTQFFKSYDALTGLFTSAQPVINDVSGLQSALNLKFDTASFTDAAVTSKLLTGLNISGTSITATDSILTAFGKLQSQVTSQLGGLIFQSTWNATTNSPTITSSIGTKGYYYIVSTEGSTLIDGISDWKAKDWVVFNGTTWDKVDNTDSVSSVNTFVGAVSLISSDIAEGLTNLYYTDNRARASISETVLGLDYNNSTGVFSATTGYSIPTDVNQGLWTTAYNERRQWDGGSTNLVAATGRTSLGLVIGTDVLAYRTFGTAANNNTGDFEVPLTFSTGLSRVDNTITNSITQYTDALARTAISLTVTGDSGTSTYNSTTGVLNIPTYTLAGLGGEPTFTKNTAFNKNFGITAGTVLEGRTFGTAANSAIGDFAPILHTHTFASLTSKPTTLAGYGITDGIVTTDSRLSDARPASDIYAWAKASVKPSYTKSEVGLGNVDNTADANKSVNYATTSGSANNIFSAYSTSGLTSPDNTTINTIGYVSGVPGILGQSDGGIYTATYSTDWQHQIFGDFRAGGLAVRGRNGGPWTAWKTVLDSSNYSSYANLITNNNQIANGAGYLTAYSETDPVFTAWNKSTGISITASQVTDFATTVTNNSAVSANTAKVTNATHTGEVTGSGALTIASGVVDLDNLAPQLKAGTDLGNVSGVVNIDCALGIHYKMNMVGAITSLTFSNYSTQQYKTITLAITGNFTIAQPATVKGDWTTFDGTLTNQIQIYLFNVTTPVFSSGLINW